MALSIRNLTRRATPRVPFGKAAETVLPGWEISLVFVGEQRAKTLNQRLRGKSYVPNVLSYKSGNESGEVIICLATLAREAPRYGLESRAYCLYLFIHALLHLKGERHSGTMKRRERALLARLVSSSRASFTLPPPTHGQTHRNRHRHRHLPGQAGGRRRAR